MNITLINLCTIGGKIKTHAISELFLKNPVLCNYNNTVNIILNWCIIHCALLCNSEVQLNTVQYNTTTVYNTQEQYLMLSIWKNSICLLASQQNFTIRGVFPGLRIIQFQRRSSFITQLSSLHEAHAGVDKPTQQLE